MPSGAFFDAFTRERALWHGIGIDAFDSPNLKGLTLEKLLQLDPLEGGALDQNSVPYVTTKRWVYDQYLLWWHRPVHDQIRFCLRLIGILCRSTTSPSDGVGTASRRDLSVLAGDEWPRRRSNARRSALTATPPVPRTSARCESGSACAVSRNIPSVAPSEKRGPRWSRESGRAASTRRIQRRRRSPGSGAEAVG